MTPDKYSRAWEIWPILVDKASRRETITYGELAEWIRMPGRARSMRVYLNPIMCYCVNRGLPALTAVVVNQDTGRPGEGLITVNQENIDAEWESVFRYDWRGEYQPTPEELKREEDRFS